MTNVVSQRQTAKKEKSTSDNGAEGETSPLMDGSVKSGKFCLLH